MPISTKGPKNKGKIYLDYAASVSPNPSSIHKDGIVAKEKLENARVKAANILGARPSEIIFTSGGTESNNLAIQGAVFKWHENNKSKTRNHLPHIITTNIEHPSVLETFELLKNRKLAEISIVPVVENGIVDPKEIKKEIKKNTILVSVGYANNEIGTLQPIREIAREIRHYRKAGRSFKNLSIFPLFHTDAVQAANYLDLNVERLGVDLLSLSGSKVEGGGMARETGRVGMLYKKRSAPIAKIFGGGDQEMGLRPGTENLTEIMKFSSALEFVQKIKEKEIKRLTALRDYFFAELRGNINGDRIQRLPNNVNMSFSDIPSDLLVIELSERGIMASAKSACKSGEPGGSYVIAAIDPDQNPEIGGVRFSLGRETTKKDIDFTVKSLVEILNKLSKWYSYHK